MIIIFGSYVKGEEIKNSDIDIAVIDSNFKIKDKIREFASRHNKEVHLQYMKKTSFEEGLREKDTLAIEIARNHVVINNTQAFVDIMWRYFNESR